jgi:hypothetical protein
MKVRSETLILQLPESVSAMKEPTREGTYATWPKLNVSSPAIDPEASSAAQVDICSTSRGNPQTTATDAVIVESKQQARPEYLFKLPRERGPPCFRTVRTLSCFALLTDCLIFCSAHSRVMDVQVNPKVAASCAFMLRYLDDQSRSPPPCIFMFLGHLPPLTVSERPKRDYERYKQPGFYQSRTAILRWLTAPRSLSELSALIRRPCACSHEERSGSIHEEGVDVFRSSGRPRPFNFLFEIFLDIIGPALIGAWRPEYTFMRPHRLLREMRRAWPSTYSDILPRGPEQTVRGLLYWLKADWEIGFDTRLVLLVTRSIARFTYFLTLPYIVTSRAFIYDGFIRPVEAACTDLQSYRRGRPPNSTHSHAINLLTTDLNILSEMVYTMADRPQRYEMTTFCAQQLLVALNHGWEALCSLDPTNAPKLPRAIQSYAAQGMIVFQSFPELDTTDLTPAFVAMVQRALEPTAGSVWPARD